MWSNVTFVYKAVVQELAESIQVWHMPNRKPFFVDAWTHLRFRAFFMPKISGSKRFFPDSLKRYIENEYYEKQAMLAPATCYHDKWLKQRIMASLQHVSSLVSFRRLIVERGNKSTLMLYMGGDTISWGKVQ